MTPLSSISLHGAAIVIDAIFGAGLSRDVDGTVLELIEALGARKLATCAVDVPSGLDGTSRTIRGAAAPADLTVTFFRRKRGHLLFPGRGLCGDVVVADIGIPADVLATIDPNTWENGPALWLDEYPWPQPETYKYKRGEVLVLGGESAPFAFPNILRVLWGVSDKGQNASRDCQDKPPSRNLRRSDEAVIL